MFSKGGDDYLCTANLVLLRRTIRLGVDSVPRPYRPRSVDHADRPVFSSYKRLHSDFTTLESVCQELSEAFDDSPVSIAVTGSGALPYPRAGSQLG
jgi:hypothetical protein